MLSSLPRFSNLARLTLPAALVAMGAVASIEGCAQETASSVAERNPAAAPARVPSHVSRNWSDRGALGARTLASTAEGSRLLPFLSSRDRSPLAPFENLLAERDRPLE